MIVDKRALRQSQFILGEFFHVDVFESHHPHGLDETRGTINIPHPGIRHAHLKEHVPTDGVNLHVHLVTQVETPLSFHHVGEQVNDVAVFAEQVQLEAVFVAFNIGTHSDIMPFHLSFIYFSACAQVPRPPVQWAGSQSDEGLAVSLGPVSLMLGESISGVS